MGTSIIDSVVALINTRLDEIAQAHSVRVLFAVESGSRAWGVASPNSDYDVRFVYVHDRDWYLSIDQQRDVIELPADNDLDINGWDLKKALKLLIKPNPVLLEWLRSPIFYRADPAVVQALAELGARTEHLRPSTYHYLRIAEGKYRQYIVTDGSVSLKKYLYCLRAVLALAWIRCRPNEPTPMTVSELRAGLALPLAVSDGLDDLLLRKARSDEGAMGPRSAALDTLIEHELAAARAVVQRTPAAHEELLDAANRLFRGIVNGHRLNVPAGSVAADYSMNFLSWERA